MTTPSAIPPRDLPEHEPKIAALEAYRSGLLSEAGGARVERHLAACAVCAGALRAMEEYQETLDAVREAGVPELDFSKMELALAREAKAQSSAIRRRRALPFGAFAAAAAVLLAFVLVTRGPFGGAGGVAHAPQARPPAVEDVEVAPEPAVVEAHVTLAAGPARVLVRAAPGAGPAAEEAARVGALVPEQARLATDDDASLEVAFADTAGLALGESTRVALRRSREDALELSFERGALAMEIRTPEPGAAVMIRSARVVVLGAGYTFEATHATFRVSFVEELDLWVDEGEVTVRSPDGSVQVVRAPGHWPADSSRDAPALRVTGREGFASSWPTLRVQHPDVVRWEIGELAFEGAGSAALQFRPGPVPVAGFDAHGRAFRSVVELGLDGLDMGADALTPEAPRARVGYLPEETIREVVQNGVRGIRRCYEQALRSDPELAVDAGARITVAMDGVVSRVRIIGELPPTLSECVQRQAGRWTFPPPVGGPMTFEVPLSFSSR